MTTWMYCRAVLERGERVHMEVRSSDFGKKEELCDKERRQSGASGAYMHRSHLMLLQPSVLLHGCVT
jgi:hypothetical protein